MDKISATLHKSKIAKNPHPILLINDVPLEMWITGIVFDPDGADTTNHLVPAQGWLIDDEDLNAAWELLMPSSVDCSTIVPLLICPDDMDLSCTVIAVEQEITNETVIWHKFGLVTHVINHVPVSVSWDKRNHSVKFKYDEFLSAFNELKRLTNEEWI